MIPQIDFFTQWNKPSFANATGGYGASDSPYFPSHSIKIADEQTYADYAKREGLLQPGINVFDPRKNSFIFLEDFTATEFRGGDAYNPTPKKQYNFKKGDTIAVRESTNMALRKYKTTFQIYDSKADDFLSLNTDFDVTNAPLQYKPESELGLSGLFGGGYVGGGGIGNPTTSIAKLKHATINEDFSTNKRVKKIASGPFAGYVVTGFDKLQNEEYITAARAKNYTKGKKIKVYTLWPNIPPEMAPYVRIAPIYIDRKGFVLDLSKITVK